MSDFVMRNPDINKEAMIKDAWVCSRNNREYPEGTVVFEVIDNNSTLEKIEETTHFLSISPSRIGKIN